MLKCTFEGVDQGTAELFQKQLSGMEEQAPSESFMCSCIEKHGKWYSGVLRLFSTEGEFSANAKSTEPTALCKDLLSQFNFAIKEWRKNRFKTKTPWFRIADQSTTRKCSTINCPLEKGLKGAGQ